MTTTYSKVNEFRQAISDSGIIPPPSIIGDGEIHRFYVKGDKSGTKNGWYVFHPEFPAFGSFGSWKQDMKEKWEDAATNFISTTEKAAYTAKKEVAYQELEDKQKKVHLECKTKFEEIWKITEYATEAHSYLHKKNVKAYGIKVLNGSLIIPVMDISLSVMGWQNITADGYKHFETGTHKKGNSFLIGDGKADVLVICEGYATGASIHEATGYDVAVAFDAGNLKPVATALRSKYLKKTIVIAADNDQWGEKNKGLEQAKEAADAIKAVLVVPASTQPIPDGEQPTDFNDFANLFSLDFVKAAIEGAIAKAVPGSWIKVVSASDLMAMDLPPRVNFLSPWFPQQGLAMVYAYRGVGKTQVSLECAYAMASGGTFLDWKAEVPVNVLFIDGEMPLASLQERIQKIAASSHHKQQAVLDFITPDMQDPAKGMLDLSRPSDQAELEPLLEGYQVIILDNLSTLCRSGKENEGESWLPVQEWCLRQRSKGRSVLIIHHSNKSGGQRGTSRKEDVLDTVISLQRPGDYSPEQGATFEVHFEKARGLTGNDVAPFLATLTTDFDGKRVWVRECLEKSTAEKVADMLNDGYSQTEIGDILKITKGAVTKAKQKAVGMGLLKEPKG
jgi:putative DNA primase/helicase